MTALKVWWAKSRWAVWAIIGLIAVIMLAVLKSLFFGGKPKVGEADAGLPPVPKALQAKVDKAEEDGLKARVEAVAVAGEQKKQLDEVMKIDDGAERRKRLAAMLKG